jgi:hypothetical protein
MHLKTASGGEVYEELIKGLRSEAGGGFSDDRLMQARALNLATSD